MQTNSWDNLRRKRLETAEHQSLKIHKREYRQKSKDRINAWASEWRKQKYAERKAFGICVKCGLNPALDKHVLCEECRIKHNSAIKNNRDLLKSHGICVQCKRNDAIHGLTICNECRLYNNQRKSGVCQHRPEYDRKYKL